MNINRITLVSCMIGTLYLAGCEKASEPPKPTSSTSEAATPTQSVAAPPSAVPPSDAAIRPTGPQGAPTSANAGTPTQANPTELTKREEQTAMPQPGQANDHSVPDTTSQKK